MAGELRFDSRFLVCLAEWLSFAVHGLGLHLWQLMHTPAKALRRPLLTQPRGLPARGQLHFRLLLLSSAHQHVVMAALHSV